MSGGYTPLFSSICTGSLCGSWPDIGLFPLVLAMKDKHGVIDVTPDYIAGVTGLPVAEVIACMKRFCAPDPRSRSSEEGGARLVLIDPANRDWGWKVVNHGKYRERARKSAYDFQRTESGRDAERKRIERGASRDVPTRPDASRDVPLSDADADAREKPRKRGSRLPSDFEPDLDYARQELPDIDAAAEAERFKDYWRAADGRTATKRDWNAAWRNWIRNCRDRGAYARVKAHGGGNGLQCLNDR